ncbi:hypothetical protein NLI96_g10182 [Meripilus lineatus]|uniref:F-box domain-containing protein n=1 Tax=Meripilus lineatus TaxID=2056292 RepID=A0AAD5YC83_9APHY|nr:hypothetical protein NLI96_g10182 [Physisporinus lineatus]
MDDAWAFHGPAARLLWNVQETLDNLMMTLPSETWEVRGAREIPPGELTFILTRAIEEHEWQRFDHYASFIRTLYIDITARNIMSWSPEVLTALHLHRSSMCTDLLPNLIKLTAITVSWDPSSNPQIAVLLGRSLRIIEVISGDRYSADDGDSVEDWTSALVGCLPSGCPNIEEVYTAELRELPTNLAQDLAQCEGLRCFRSDAPVSIKTGMDFLQLHKLHDLSLNILEGEDENPNAIVPRINAHLLTKLGLRLHEPPYALKFLAHCNFPVLQSMSLSVEEPQFLPSYITALYDHCEPALIRTFDVQFLPPDMLSQYAFPCDFILTLLRFKSLQEVVLSTLPLLADDTLLREMAMAWPQLAKLRMADHRRGSSTRSQFTLVGLVPLAQQCPKLKELWISVTGDPPPFPIRNLPGHGLSRSQLQTIDFYDSPVNQTIRTAAFLSGLFPELTTIIAGKHYDRWERVKTGLQLFKEAREQEREGMLHIASSELVG